MGGQLIQKPVHLWQQLSHQSVRGINGTQIRTSNLWELPRRMILLELQLLSI